MSTEEPIEYYFDTMIMLMALLGLIRRDTYFHGGAWFGGAEQMRARLMRYR